jgi:hypothetical protein
MRVFKPTGPEDQEWAILLDEAYRQTLMALDCTPRRETWTPPPVRLLKSSERKKLRYSDMPHYSSNVLILREPAVDALGALLGSDGELLPLDCADAPLWLFNCCRVVDALDEQQSQFVRFPSSRRNMRVEAYAFWPERLAGLYAFKIPQMPRGPLFVTQPVVQAAEQTKLVRADFKLVWEDQTE